MQLCQLADAETSLAIAEHSVTIEDQFGTADVLAFQLGAAHAGFHSFNNKVAFQLGNGADDDDHGASQRATGVDVFAKGNEADVEMIELIQRFQEVSDGARQPVERPDHDHVKAAAAGITQHAIQAGPAGPAAGKPVDILVNDRKPALLHQL